MSNSKIISNVLKSNYKAGNGWKNESSYNLFLAHDQTSVDFTKFPMTILLKHVIVVIEPQLNGTSIMAIKY